MKKNLSILILVAVLATVMYIISGYPKPEPMPTITPTKTVVAPRPTKPISGATYWCGEMAGNKPCPEGYACRFIQNSSSGQCEKCPEVEYVDCMPGPDKFDSRCSPEYLNWAKANCPDFKGAAY
jgi:hypothetical protein